MRLLRVTAGVFAPAGPAEFTGGHLRVFNDQCSGNRIRFTYPTLTSTSLVYVVTVTIESELGKSMRCFFGFLQHNRC